MTLEYWLEEWEYYWRRGVDRLRRWYARAWVEVSLFIGRPQMRWRALRRKYAELAGT